MECSPRSVRHRPTVRPSTRHKSWRPLECWCGGGAEEQLTGLRTDRSPPHGPNEHRVIKRLDGPLSSCSQVQTRRTHAHRSIYIISCDILRRRAIYKCVARHSLQYTRISRIIRLTGKPDDDVTYYIYIWLIPTK